MALDGYGAFRGTARLALILYDMAALELNAIEALPSLW